MISRGLESIYPAYKRLSAKRERVKAWNAYPSCCDDTVDLHFAVDSQDRNLPIFTKLRGRAPVLFDLFVYLSSSIEQTYNTQNVFWALCTE